MKRYLILSLLALSVFLPLSCEKGYEVEVAGNDARYQSARQAVISLRNEEGKAYFATVEMREDRQDVPVTGRLLGSAAAGAEARLSFGDAGMVERYNELYGTAYEAFPAENASLSEDRLVFRQGSADAQAPVQVSLQAEGLRPGTTYMLPLVSSTTSTGTVAGDPMYLLIKDFRSIPNNDKGVVMFSCIESDDTSVLDNMAFRLRNSGQYLIDVVIIFTSSSVNFSSETGEISMPSNIGTYYQTAHQKGIIDEVHNRGCKVLCTITTHGIAQMDLDAGKEFARKLADFVYAFNLDGIFFDTEYTSFDSSRPGFTGSSTENMARFLLELKRCMPDKMVVTYLYSTLSGLRNVSESDGVPLKDFVDYGLNDYGATIVPAALGNERVGIYSDNFAESYRNISCSNTSRCRTAGTYGAHMFYCLTASRYLNPSSSYRTTRNCLNNIASIWFNDAIVCEPLEDTHKDW